MSEARQRGTWSPVYDGMDEHPKTRAAAAVLVEELGLHPDLAAAVVVRAVGRLVRWAMRESDTGRTGHLSDGDLAVVAWPGALVPGGPLWGRDDVGVIRRALRAVPAGHQRGYLYLWAASQGHARVEFLHEFQAYAWLVLRKRPHYAGTSLADFAACPYGRRGAPASAFADTATTVGASAAPVDPEAAGELGRAAGADVAPPADGLDGETLVERSSNARATLGQRSTQRSDDAPATLERNPLQGNGRPGAGSAPARRPLGALSASASAQAELKISGSGAGSGWKDVPTGVAAGERDAIAAWLRSIQPLSHARLYPEETYVARWQEATVQIAPVGRFSGSGPGAAFERCEPVAFGGLVDDLVAHLPDVSFPRKYAARSLASRWEEQLGKRADEAAKRRAEWRGERHSG